MNVSMVVNTTAAPVQNTKPASIETTATSSQNTVVYGDNLTAAENRLIKKLQEQIIKVSEDPKLDEDIKKAKIADLKNQIIEIQERQRQRQLEALRQKDEEKSTNKSIQNEESATVEISRESKNILDNAQSLKDLKHMNSVRTNLKGASSVLRTEIKTDNLRGVDTEQKQEELYNIERGIRKVEESMSEEISDTNKRVEQRGYERNKEPQEDEEATNYTISE